jgi:hypothetical protein
MLFMVIERFRDRDPLPVYRRLREEGRMTPPGLEFKESWVEPSFERCFQLMECGDARLLQQWVLAWRGTGVSMEIVPVVAGPETAGLIAPYLAAGA